MKLDKPGDCGAHGITWPYTGRLLLPHRKTQVVNIHKPWLDLLQLNPETKNWEYVSTVPNDESNQSKLAAHAACH